MNERFAKRLAALLSVKSLVTLALTAVFAVLTLKLSDAVEEGRP